MKITLFIMTKKGLAVLNSIVNSFGPEVIQVVHSDTDPNVVNDYYSEILRVCQMNNISFNDNSPEEIETEYAIAIGWKYLIQTDEKLIVLHDSILPKYKGWAPLVNALIEEEPFIGATAFVANKEADEGEIISQQYIPIEYPIKVADAIDLLIPIYCQICTELLTAFAKGKLPSFTSPISFQESYSMWRDNMDYRIDWNEPAHRIVNFVNAVGFPYEGALTLVSDWDKPIRVIDCETYPDVNIINRKAHIGKVFKVVDKKYVVICGEGLLKINEIQTGLSMSKFKRRFF